MLKSFYKHSPADIANALQRVLALDGLRTQRLDLVSDALSSMARHNVDFADTYLAEQGKAEKMSVATFDRDFQRLGGQILES